MQKLLMMGTTGASIAMVQEAKSRGVYTIVTDYLAPDESEAKLISDEYWMISTADLDTLEQKCREEGVTGIIAGISEFNIPRTAELCRRLNLPCYCTPESWEAVQKKHNFKKVCRENGVPVATDYFLSNPPTEEELDGIVFPVVVKPVDGCGNKGMSYCYSKEDVVKACAFARSESHNETIIVERMLEGVEYIAHYAMADGHAVLFSFAAMLSEEGYPENCYSLTTTGTDQLSHYLEEVDPAFTKALHQAGCHEGVGWCEMILDKDGHFYLLEMGYRMTGDMIAWPLNDVTGFDSVRWLVDIALGKKHMAADLPPRLTSSPEKCVCAYILWSKKEGAVATSRGLEKIASMPNVYVQDMVEEKIESQQYDYMAVISFSADNCTEMCKTIDTINRTVQILDEEGSDMIIYYTDFLRLEEMYGQGLRQNHQEDN